MINLVINGKDRQMESCSVEALLRNMGINSRWVAVELNGKVVDRDAFDSTILREGNKLEIITPIGGG